MPAKMSVAFIVAMSKGRERPGNCIPSQETDTVPIAIGNSAEQTLEQRRILLTQYPTCRDNLPKSH
jgi:hypothetical protein